MFYHSFFFVCHWISFVFLLFNRRICIHFCSIVRPSQTHTATPTPLGRSRVSFLFPRKKTLFSLHIFPIHPNAARVRSILRLASFSHPPSSVMFMGNIR